MVQTSTESILISLITFLIAVLAKVVGDIHRNVSKNLRFEIQSLFQDSIDSNNEISGMSF